MMNLKLLLFGLIISWTDGAALDEVNTGNYAFSAALYKELIKSDNGNLVISPFSVYVLLSLTESGARDQTAEEIRTSLSLPNGEEAIQRIFKRVLPMVKSDANVTVNTAYKVYVKDDLTLQDEFQRVVREVYEAEAESIDFEEKEEAAEAINRWVEEQTEDKIQNLISPDDIDSTAAVILVNALHFKGQWENGFDSTMTRTGTFYTSTRELVEAEMMYNVPIYRNYDVDEELGAQFLEMGFSEKHYISMVIVLPNNNEGIATLEQQIEKVLAPRNFQRRLVEVQIPKFKVESTMGLGDMLKNLGVRRAFIPGEADLSGIVNERADLYISEVQQKAFIDVDEKGVEGAAATFSSIAEMSAIDENPQKFVANHPFIFYIKFNDLILFVGRVNVPTQ